VSVLVRFVVRSFSTNSRPALRAAACGGRPRAGNTTTATGAPDRGIVAREARHQKVLQVTEPKVRERHGARPERFSPAAHD